MPINFRANEKKRRSPGATHPGMGIPEGGQIGKLSSASRTMSNREGGRKAGATTRPAGFFKTKYGAEGKPGFGFFKGGQVYFGAQKPKSGARIISSPMSGVTDEARQEGFRKYLEAIGGRHVTIKPTGSGKPEFVKGELIKPDVQLKPESPAYWWKGTPEYIRGSSDIESSHGTVMAPILSELASLRAGNMGLFRTGQEALGREASRTRRDIASSLAQQGLFKSGTRDVASGEAAADLARRLAEHESQFGKKRISDLIRARAEADADRRRRLGALASSVVAGRLVGNAS